MEGNNKDEQVSSFSSFWEFGGHSIIPVFLCTSTSIYLFIFFEIILFSLLAEAAQSLLHYIPIASNATTGPST